MAAMRLCQQRCRIASFLGRIPSIWITKLKHHMCGTKRCFFLAEMLTSNKDTYLNAFALEPPRNVRENWFTPPTLLPDFAENPN